MLFNKEQIFGIYIRYWKQQKQQNLEYIKSPEKEAMCQILQLAIKLWLKIIIYLESNFYYTLSLCTHTHTRAPSYIFQETLGVWFIWNPTELTHYFHKKSLFWFSLYSLIETLHFKKHFICRIPKLPGYLVYPWGQLPLLSIDLPALTMASKGP